MNSVHTGWHRALDVQMDTLKWLKQDYGVSYSYNFFNGLIGADLNRVTKDFDLLNFVSNLCSTLWQADTVFITTDMMHLLLQAAHDLPQNVVFEKESMLSPRGFVLFEEPIDGIDRNGRKVTMHAMAWVLDRVRNDADESNPLETIIIYYFTDPTDFNDEFNEQYIANCARDGVPVPPLVLAHLYPCRIGEPMPDYTVQGSELVVGIVKLFVAMQLLAQQKIGAPIRLDPDRASRKRFAREFPNEPQRFITLITLRRKSVKKDDEEPQKIEWSRRWVVSGHWRRQYYSKTKTHSWVYIYEHIKGPEDKPLIITERRVFNFRR